VVVVIEGAAFTVIVSEVVVEVPSASATLTVNVDVTAPPPTVPLMTPVPGTIASPDGRDPVVDQVYGVVPPVATTVDE
jgi:hypothetical protein